MPKVSIGFAWGVIEACEYRDRVDGTCDHPKNMTPECHAAVCPLADDLALIGDGEGSDREQG